MQWQAVWGQRLWQVLVTPAIALLSLGTIAALQLTSLRDLEQKSQQVLTPAEYQQEAQQIALKLKLLQKVPSFGFDNLIADGVFLQFLQFFGDTKARAQTGYGLAPNFFEVIIPRDPQFLRAYLFLSVSSTIYAGRPDLTVALMDQGLKSLSPKAFPDSYTIWVFKANDELLFLGNYRAAQKSYQTAAEWVSLQGTPEAKATAVSLQRTATFLKRKPNSKTAQINAWMMVLSNAFDDRTRKLALQNLQRLGVKITVLPTGKLKFEAPKPDWEY
ncbi:MAG: hypothetical protein KME35_09455 [Aphanocapsa sp. GSE-SYN-MK-11-07L]|jgi:hypothetical protein|nr:hypothetical protein [Aphanocapsa sp. GSE-SYN-MK-11-07L]